MVVEQCKENECAVHNYLTGSLARFESVIEKLVEGQQQTQVNIAKLNENLDMLKRLHSRVDSLEKFMWKAVGGGGLAVLLLPVFTALMMKFI